MTADSDNRIRLLWLFPVTFLLITAATLFYAVTQRPVYEARAVVQFSPRNTVNGGVVGAEIVATSAAGYAAYLGAPATVQSLSRVIGVPQRDFRSGAQARLLPATTTLAISFSAGNPAVAARAANAMASAAVDRTAGDPLVRAAVLAPATRPLSPAGPQRPLIMVGGILLALIVATVVTATALALSAGGWRRWLHRVTALPAEPGGLSGGEPPAEAVRAAPAERGGQPGPESLEREGPAERAPQNGGRRSAQPERAVAVPDLALTRGDHGEPAQNPAPV